MKITLTDNDKAKLLEIARMDAPDNPEERYKELVERIEERFIKEHLRKIQGILDDVDNTVKEFRSKLTVALALSAYSGITTELMASPAEGILELHINIIPPIDDE